MSDSGSPSRTSRSATAPAVTVPDVGQAERAGRAAGSRPTMPSSADSPPSTMRTSSIAFSPGGPLSWPMASVTPGGARGDQRGVGLLELALGLLDERRRERVGEALGQVVERAQRGHEHDPAPRHRVQQRRLAVQRQAVLDRVDAGVDGQPRALEPLDVGGHADAEAVGLVDDRLELGRGHLGGLGILGERPSARRWPSA